MDWMIDNQLSRQNLPPMLLRYLRGKRYLLEKQQGKRHDLTSAQIEQKLTTNRKLAKQYGGSASTIRRDASFARDVDTLNAALSPERRRAVLSRDFKLTQRDTQELAKLARYSPEKVPELVVQLSYSLLNVRQTENRAQNRHKGLVILLGLAVIIKSL